MSDRQAELERMWLAWPGPGNDADVAAFALAREKAARLEVMAVVRAWMRHSNLCIIKVGAECDCGMDEAIRELMEKEPG